MRPDPAARERACVDVLRELEGTELVVVGGYAVAAFGPYRATVDLDLVVPSRAVPEIQALLRRHGFRHEKGWARGALAGRAERWALESGALPTSVDLLIDQITDRRSGVTHSFEALRPYSKMRTVGTHDRSVTATVPVADPEVLIALKFPVGRLVDLRDVAILAAQPLRIDVVFTLLESCPREVLSRNVTKLLAALETDNFRDSLKGVYQLDERAFERYARAAKDLCDRFAARFLQA